MRSPRPSRHLASLTTAVVLLGAALPLRADDPVVHYAEPTEPRGFFHGVSDFFRDLFATEQSLSPRPTPPRPTAPRYNLDLPAPGTGYGYGTNYRSHSSVTATERDMTNTHNTASTAPPTKKPAKRPAPAVTSTEPENKPTEHVKPQPASKPKHSNTVASEDRTPPPTTSTESPRTPNPAPKTETKNVPSGTRTSKSTRVKSPYPPYNELDVTGLSSGSLAMDPTTQKVFRVP